MSMDFSASGIYCLNRKRGGLWGIHKEKKENAVTVNISTERTGAKKQVNAAGMRHTQALRQW